MKFYVIGDKDTVIGFSLVGVEGFEANSETEAAVGLKQAIKNNKISIILITERIADKIQPIIDELLFTKERSVIILQIPDIKGKMPAKRSIEEFVLSSVGVKL